MGNKLRCLGGRLRCPAGATAMMVVAATVLGCGTATAPSGLPSEKSTITAEPTVTATSTPLVFSSSETTITESSAARQSDGRATDMVLAPQAAPSETQPLATDDNSATRPVLASRGDRPKSGPADVDRGAETEAQAADKPTSHSNESKTPVRQETAPFAYTVADGDTVSGIADRFGIDSTTIVWANELENKPDTLAVGQSLTILPVSGVLHEARLGDTVDGIGDLHGVKASTIISANAIANPDAILIGQRLVVPGGKPLPPAPVVATVPKKTQTAPTAPTAERQSQVANAAQPSVASTQAPKASSPEPAQTDNGIGSKIVAVASSFNGYDYLWGGHSPSTGFDCTGFTWYVYKQVGLQIPMHDLEGQVAAGPQIPRSKLQPGDLVFFQNTYKPGLSHAGIYVGGGQFINAASENTGVRFDSLDDAYWGPRWYGASRPW